MLKGFYLTLLVGPGVPVPAPQAVVDAVTSVQVTSGGTRTGFQVTFAVSKTSPLLRTLLPAGYFDPIVTRVILVVTIGGVPTVISDGVVTQQQMSPAGEAGQSTLTITGEDLSVLMDVVEMPFMRYPAMNELAIVNLALAKYLPLGIVPAVVPPVFTAFPNPLDKIPTQTGTDLEYVRLLAARNGYVFYVEPGPTPGANVAYWGPDLRNPAPQPALSVNMDAQTNVESLSFTLDGLAKKVFVATVFDPVTQKVPIPIPVPNVNVLRPPLGLRPTVPARVEFPDDLAGLDPLEAAKRILGKLFTANDAVTASGSLNVLRYGRPLQSRRVVGVRGAGLTYDGFYSVNSVTHSIRRGEYKQSFTLSRDGLIANTPRVPA